MRYTSYPLSRCDETLSTLWRNSNVNNVEHGPDHAIIVLFVTLHVEGNVVIVIRFNDVVIEMHPGHFGLVIRFGRILRKVNISIQLFNDPSVRISV